MGRIVPSAAATESCFPIRGNPKNDIARFEPLNTLQSQTRAPTEISILDQSPWALFTDDSRKTDRIFLNHDPAKTMLDRVQRAATQIRPPAAF
jgi:hypothetical protein